MKTTLAAIDLTPVTDALTEITGATVTAGGLIFSSALIVGGLIWFGIASWRLFKDMTKGYDNDEDRAEYDRTHDKF